MKISSLLKALDSPSAQKAKIAAKQLDEAIYPKRKPEVVTIEQYKKTDEEHFQRLRGTAIADLLVKTLSNGKPNARCYAACALTSISDNRTLPLVLAALKDSDAIVRVAAINCCPRLRDESTVAPLI